MIGHMDIAGFDLNLMKAFDALYAERHVTRAGSRIGLSQSAMSGALTRLRELLADELFVRTPSGMQPTPRAMTLLVPSRMRSGFSGARYRPIASTLRRPTIPSRSR
jgi:hypothetical protein